MPSDTANKIIATNLGTFSPFYAIQFQIHLSPDDTLHAELWRHWLHVHLSPLLEFLDDTSKPTIEGHPHKPDVVRFRLRRRFGHFLQGADLSIAALKLHAIGLRVKYPIFAHTCMVETPWQHVFKPASPGQLPPREPFTYPLAGTTSTERRSPVGWHHGRVGW